MDSKQFSWAILNWFKCYGRHNFPWQKDVTPYRVWVSEIMLQQTRVATVIPYFECFMQQFPTLKILALANVDKVLTHWSGLGYYARARNLHRTAQIIHEKYQDQFPTTVEGLIALPGIGQSTAGAILSLSMHRYAVILDGNAKRVLARYHALNIPIHQSYGIKLLWDLAKKYTPQNNYWNYNQAIMDIGSMICTHKKPKCPLCPLKNSCSAYQKNRQTEFPIKKPKINRIRKGAHLIILQNSEGHILLEKRPPVGIWGGLWSFPECPADVNIECWYRTKFNISDDTIKLERWNSFLHKFSHFDLEINPILLQTYTRALHIMESKSQIWYKEDSPLPGGVAVPIAWLIRQLKQRKYMVRRIFCQKLSKEADALNYQPYPGELGQRIYSQISKQAWQAWLSRQTILINEYRLNLIDPKARYFLEQEMEKFLFDTGNEKSSGFFIEES